MCCGFFRWILARDKRGAFRFGTLQSPEAQALLFRISLPDPLPDSLVLIHRSETGGSEIDQSKIHFRSEAVLRALRNLGQTPTGRFWRRVAALASLIPVAWRDRIYDFVAARRYRIGSRRETCLLPTPEQRRHFL